VAYFSPAMDAEPPGLACETLLIQKPSYFWDELAGCATNDATNALAQVLCRLAMELGRCDCGG